MRPSSLNRDDLLACAHGTMFGPGNAQLPAPPAQRQSANTGGMVVDMFRDAANDLELVEDEWRYGVRDAPPDDAEPVVIDLDDAA